MILITLFRMLGFVLGVEVGLCILLITFDIFCKIVKEWFI